MSCRSCSAATVVSRWSMDEDDAGAQGCGPRCASLPRPRGPRAFGVARELATRSCRLAAKILVGAGHYHAQATISVPRRRRDRPRRGRARSRPLAGTDERARTACEPARGRRRRRGAPARRLGRARVIDGRTLQRIDAEARGSLGSRSVSTGSLLPLPPRFRRDRAGNRAVAGCARRSAKRKGTRRRPTA